jgi:ubiquinone/menaquinone biosynthesis C-methylase UbiE
MNSPVIQANIDLHTALAKTYPKSEPHFRQENKDKVRSTLIDLVRQFGSDRLLDLGCGTGFLIDLAGDLFKEIHGVDVTKAMIDQVDTSRGNVTLQLSPAEAVPYPDNYFDVVTAYAFLHHTEDYRRIFKEAHRVLKPGGVFFSAQDPSRLFWNAIKNLGKNQSDLQRSSVRKAYEAVHHTEDLLEQEYGTPRELVEAAEPLRVVLGGLDPQEVRNDAKAIGFAACEVRLTWFLGEAEVIHGQSAAAASIVNTYLRSASPLTDHLFKYVDLVLTK